MSFVPEIGPLTGTWTYRSLQNDPDVNTAFNDLEFGRGNIDIEAAPQGVFKGRIYGPGWELQLNGSISYGNPNTVRFQGRGVVGGEEWIYDYIGYLSPPWPNGIDQRPALAGSIVRTIPHASGAGGVSPAGVVCTWYAVLDKPAA
ncbi:hypothetical protein SAMN02745857_02847 [Andreprevotia lacus DSM 23236]|jgi:hypothetical protein|uniref:Uncharacterized protein n=1 Tax=Andreprevotia lacus DSM 23236 TaxID=1121001 RepID=A0A1W1XU92_9NEIS|nr:hypothetical protein [Andreprevotia lacus]SMC27432.1 hypothetical protein SAMN02745857_02847 [Andreprevotia lacus DSM 23236]